MLRLQAPALGASVITGIGNAALRQIAAVFTVSIGQAPGVARAMWPQGDSDATAWQMSNLKTEVQNSMYELETMLNNGLKVIMNNVTEFVNFADHGAYSNEATPDVIQNSQGIDFALSTFLVSETMSRNGYYIMTPTELIAQHFETMPKMSCGSRHRAQLPYCTMAKGDTLKQATKGFRYYSETSQREYYLRVNKRDGLDYKGEEELLNYIEEQGWTNLDALFDNAYECHIKGGARNDNIVNIDPNTGVVDTSCVSRLPVTRQCGLGCPWPVDTLSQCPFPDECFDGYANPKDRPGCVAIMGPWCARGPANY